jgi:hypothetical protein
LLLFRLKTAIILPTFHNTKDQNTENNNLATLIYGCENIISYLEVHDNKLLWIKYGPKKDKVSRGQFRILQNKVHCNSYRLSGTVRIAKSRKL